jgi:hypothetical protein
LRRLQLDRKGSLQHIGIAKGRMLVPGRHSAWGNRVDAGAIPPLNDALTAIEKHTHGTCHYAKDDEGQL